MLKYGNICEVNYLKGLARVDFDDLGIVSDWLSLPTTSTKGTKHFIPLEINTQVAVLMHKDGEQGEIVKAIWSTQDNPPAWADKDTEGIQFSDGTIITYNTSTHLLSISIEDGNIIINGGDLGGLVKAKELKEQSEKDKAILDALLQVITGSSISEPGNGAPSALQLALQGALVGKQSGTWNSLENDKIKQ